MAKVTGCKASPHFLRFPSYFSLNWIRYYEISMTIVYPNNTVAIIIKMLVSLRISLTKKFSCKRGAAVLGNVNNPWYFYILPEQNLT